MFYCKKSIYIKDNSGAKDGNPVEKTEISSPLLTGPGWLGVYDSFYYRSLMAVWYECQ